MKKILITDYVWPNIKPEAEILEKSGLTPIVAPDSSENTLAELARDVEGIMFCFAEITSKILENASHCKVASRYGIGVDNINISRATELGIIVTNVPDYCMDEVTDHALGMILALNRRFLQHTKKVVKDGWNSVSLNQIMHRTRGSTLGIVGFGRIGQSLAKKCKSFGFNLIAYDPLLRVGDNIDGVRLVKFIELIKTSDFISLHVPLIPETQGMIGQKELSMMKKGAILVNCARGGLIDENALAKSIYNGHLSGAGLDVVEPTPPKSDNPLLKLDNVIITPHTAFFSQASTLELEKRTANEVIRVINGNNPENWINPEVSGNSRSGI
tara:strand:+ start:43950 stop:44933 length:984 start_codon:yes stop_codon:yes gene_type:complete